ncbi:hypothetical protein HWV62_6333 [Athelia sp. TMB]|nr:hypothetical protein HWV62_6333 [Athelia sp. TMB]
MSKVSFTIRRPHHLEGSRSSTGSPAPKRTYSDRELERDDRDEDDSDAESAVDDELVTGFDRFGVQRVHEKKPPKGPLTIPAQADRDWRALARQRRGHVPAYVPPSAAAQTGADGSVGGLGTRDAINSGPQLSGIQMRKKIKLEEDPDARSSRSRSPSPAHPDKMDVEENAPQTKKEDEDEDARALRALLDPSSAGPSTALAAIPVRMTEAEAYKQDVETFPEPATLDDYARVPIEQFGAALLRGMGWDPDAAKSGSSAPHKNAKGVRMEGREGGKRRHVEPYIPAARPALLGIGAKEAEVLDDGSDPKKRKGGGRPEKRYVPLVKVGTGASADASTSEQRVSVRGERERGSASGSGDGRRERDRTCDDRDRERPRDDRDRDRDRDRNRDRDGRRDRDRDYRDRDDRPRDRDRERPRDSDRDRDRDRPRESDRDKERGSSRRR